MAGAIRKRNNPKKKPCSLVKLDPHICCNLPSSPAGYLPVELGRRRLNTSLLQSVHTIEEGTSLMFPVRIFLSATRSVCLVRVPPTLCMLYNVWLAQSS
jgi:hypothetical protein